jgi:hypothetical protein
MLQSLDRIDDMGPLVDFGSQQIFQHHRGFETPLSHGGEEVKEAFITGQKAHGRLRRLVTMR